MIAVLKVQANPEVEDDTFVNHVIKSANGMLAVGVHGLAYLSVITPSLLIWCHMVKCNGGIR